jgi:hypothetical protein
VYRNPSQQMQNKVTLERAEMAFRTAVMALIMQAIDY